METIITMLYNNVPGDERLEKAWGMSCLIEGLEETILFDTGGDGRILLANMRKLDRTPEEVDLVILSHAHIDHTGGLWEFLRECEDVDVFFGRSFPDEFREKAEGTSARFVEVDAPVDVGTGIHLTGELGTDPREEALILRMSEGLVVATGCAHPGIVDVVKKVEEICGDEIHLVLGGFHLMMDRDEEVEEVIGQLKGLGVQRIAPSHCTGERPIEMFREAWGENFIDLGCGDTVRLGNVNGSSLS